MTTKSKSGTTEKQLNDSLPSITQIDGMSLDEALNAFEQMDNKDLRSVTSDLLKMEAGEEIKACAVYHPEFNEELDGDNNEKYSCAVIMLKGGEKKLIADTVFLNAQEKMFKANPDKKALAVRIICKGMRKANGSNNQYRDFDIRSL